MTLERDAMDLPRNRPEVLGATIDPLELHELNRLVADAIRNLDKIVIANHNLHSLYLFNRDLRMRRFYQSATRVQVDRMSLILLSRLKGYRLRREHRVTCAGGSILWRRRQPGRAGGCTCWARGAWRAGAGRDGPSSDISCARSRNPHGYFDARAGNHENHLVLEKIAEFGPQLLLVGMGMPRQEHWVLENLGSLRANVILTGGACIDYLAGQAVVPPRWLGPLGLEWAYRFYREPRRLAFRYLPEPWWLAPLIVRDEWLARHRRATARRPPEDRLQGDKP
jgi:N-acetylglucosaminyldiphosphoundecaprenol N-acetyl-beta-D-mannosaminyltransferase